MGRIALPASGEGRVGPCRRVPSLAKSCCSSIPSTAISSRKTPRAAERVLTRAGYRVTTPEPAVGRPLCCGRTFLGAGLVDEARKEARRMLDALAPAIAAGTPIVGLEPACLLTLRDEFPAMLPGRRNQGARRQRASCSRSLSPPSARPAAST